MWKVFQPQLYNYHVSGNKILTSMIFATKRLKQQNSKWITSYCYYQLYCFGLLIIKFFLISTPCNSKFLQIELYRDIIIVLIHFGVHGLWFKSKIIYKRSGTFLPWERVWDFNCLFPTVQWARDGEDHMHTAQSPCTKWSEGPWRHPRGRGARGDTRGHVATGSSHNIRAEPGPPPTAVNTLAWHRFLLAGRSTAQLQKVFYRKIMLSSNPPKSVFTFAPLQPLDTG